MLCGNEINKKQSSQKYYLFCNMIPLLTHACVHKHTHIHTHARTHSTPAPTKIHTHVD